MYIIASQWCYPLFPANPLELIKLRRPECTCRSTALVLPLHASLATYCHCVSLTCHGAVIDPLFLCQCLRPSYSPVTTWHWLPVLPDFSTWIIHVSPFVFALPNSLHFGSEIALLLLLACGPAAKNCSILSENHSNQATRLQMFMPSYQLKFEGNPNPNPYTLKCSLLESLGLMLHCLPLWAVLLWLCLRNFYVDNKAKGETHYSILDSIQGSVWSNLHHGK